jgi:hypothetical protein
MESLPVVAISTGDHKLAALFFDLIVPTHSAENVPEDIRYRAHGDLALPYSRIADFVDDVFPSLSSDAADDERLRASHMVDDRWAAHLHGFFEEHGIASVPLFTLPESYQQYNKPGEHYGIEYTLTSVPIVNTAGLGWDHVLDVRTDDDFRQKARALRLFLARDYEGKDRSYIIDDIARRIEEHEESCKKHGLDVLITTLAKTLDSKTLLGTIGMAAAGILTGNPSVTALGAISGTVIEIGKVGLHIAEKGLQLRATSDEVALSYLIDLKNRANQQ